MPLQLRRGTQNELNAITPLEGELIYVRPTPPLTTPKLFVGDGSTEGGILVTGLNENDAKAAAGQALESGNHVGIRFSYDSGNRIINATVDLSEATFNTINGSVVANDSTILVNAETGVITATSLNIGSASITSVGSFVNLPAGSTLGGNVIGVTVGSDESTTVTVSNGNTLSILGDEGAQTFVEGGALKIKAIGNLLTPRAQSGESTPFYIPLVANFEGTNEVRSAGSLNYVPSTETLSIPNIQSTSIATTTITGVNEIGATLVSTGQVQAIGGSLVLSTLFNNPSDASNRLVQIGSGLVDGRLGVVTNSYFGNQAFATFTQAHDTQDVANFQFYRTRNNTLSPGSVVANDKIADITFSSHNGTIQVFASALLTVKASQILPGNIVSGGNVTGQFEFSTQRKDVAPNSGPSLALTIDDNQTAKFSGAVKFPVYANPTARDDALTVGSSSVSGAPRTSIVEPGMVVFLSDSTGSGGAPKLQIFDGSTWIDLH